MSLIKDLPDYPGAVAGTDLVMISQEVTQNAYKVEVAEIRASADMSSAFSVYAPDPTPSSNGENVVAKFKNSHGNLRGEYSTATGYFTPTSGGMYILASMIEFRKYKYFSDVGAPTTVNLKLYSSVKGLMAASYYSGEDDGEATPNNYKKISLSLYVGALFVSTVPEYFWVQYSVNKAEPIWPDTIDDGQYGSYFSGAKKKKSDGGP